MPLTEKQHQARASGLGGSDAPAVAGLSPYRSPLDVWLEKTGQSTVEPDAAALERMHFGNMLEPVIAEEAARRNGFKVARVNKTLYHKQHPFMLTHLDRRIVGLDGVLECKATGRAIEEPMEPHVVQVLHQLAVTGASFGLIAYLCGGNKYLQFRVERDEEAIEALIRIESVFWRHVETRTPPPPVNLKDVARLYPSDAGAPALAPDGIVAEARRLAELRASIKAAEAEADAAELAIKASMGEAPVLLGPDGRELATWKVQTARRLDQQRLRTEAPEIYQQFTHETTSRVFRLKIKEVA